MRRFMRVVAVALAFALAAAACGDNVDDRPSAGEPQSQSDTTTSEGPSEDAVESYEGPSDIDAAVDGAADGEADEPEPEPDASEEIDDPVADDVDAMALLAAANTQLDGRSVRGEATIGDPEAPIVGVLATSFMIAADGDLAVTFELPAGLDPQFPDGGILETRYVDGVTYVRPLVTDEMMAELGIGDGEAWYIADPAAVDDAMAQELGATGGMMCLFPQSGLEAPLECDPLADTAGFFEAASEAEVVGREELRGTQTTRIRFQASLAALSAAGGVPSDDDSMPVEGEEAADLFGLMDGALATEVWLDDEGLIRRLTIDLFSMFAGLAGEEAADAPSILMTLEFYDFGADISVDAPPPETIIDNPGPFEISGGEASAG